MKKIIPLFTAVTLMFTGAAMAKPTPPGPGGFIGDQATQERCVGGPADCRGPQMGGMGGFQGPSISVSTVEQVKQMNDDQKVALRGYIIQSLGDEDYMFKDDTGTIQVEIDHKRWRGQVITPNDLVEIQGEVDKDWKSINVDVKRIIKLHADK